MRRGTMLKRRGRAVSRDGILRNYWPRLRRVPCDGRPASLPVALVNVFLCLLPGDRSRKPPTMYS